MKLWRRGIYFTGNKLLTLFSVFCIFLHFLRIDEKYTLPAELRELYSLYQQEIHASIYNGANPGYDIYQLEKLPPLHTRRETTSSSSSGSEWSSPISDHLYNDTLDPDIVMGPPVAPKVPYI